MPDDGEGLLGLFLNWRHIFDIDYIDEIDYNDCLVNINNRNPIQNITQLLLKIRPTPTLVENHCADDGDLVHMLLMVHHRTYA